MLPELQHCFIDFDGRVGCRYRTSRKLYGRKETKQDRNRMLHVLRLPYNELSE